MKSSLLGSTGTFVAAIACSTVLGTGRPAIASNVRPPCIPAVQLFTPLKGIYKLQKGARIVVIGSQHQSCIATAELLAHEVYQEDGIKLPVVTSSPRAGDIRLLITKSTHAVHPGEYNLTVGSTVTARAYSADGLFYATRTLLQYLNRHRTIHTGITVDWPNYQFRGLMIDVGRKYFSIQWLKHVMQLMAAVKLNVLHLHFTDDEGFRLQSRSHPELNVGTSPLYSHEDIRSLVRFADIYHIDIVPEIDFPAHCGAVLKAHPELRLASTSGKTLPNDMDISKPGAASLVADILHEFLPLFPGQYWHCGGDEYLHRAQYSQYPQLAEWAHSHIGPNAAPWDTFIAFINKEDAIVRAAGKTMRAWADTYEFQAEGTDPLKLNNDICQELWNGYDNPEQMMQDGFKISNASYPVLYYNVGDGPTLPARQATQILSDWNPQLFFQHTGTWMLAPHSANLQGACYHVWADNADAETEQVIAHNILLPLCAVAEKCWNSTAVWATTGNFKSMVKAVVHTEVHS